MKRLHGSLVVTDCLDFIENVWTGFSMFPLNAVLPFKPETSNGIEST